MPEPVGFTMRASRPWPVRASASTCSEAVEPPYPGTSSTGPGRSWATGSTGGSRRTTTATAIATATTSASAATPSTSRRRAGDSESSTGPVCVGTRHDFVRRRTRVTPETVPTVQDMPTRQLPLRPPSEADFTSRLRSAAVTARVGLWLGICFGICFATGLISHYAQNADHPIPFPTSPGWGYRLTQGLHVVTGTAAVPLLLVKLWTVYPKLFRRPEKNLRALALDGLEQASILALVASAVFQLATGILNSAAVVPVGLLVPGHATTRWPGWRSARWSCTSRSSCRSSDGR